ncbi:MAG: hypothetical protein HXY52_08145 [Nitrospirae bacterium]|jgi:tRNA A-37 threonylcarbamoyl transferase component Bud32|nr:hypothetical protein [Nitrospirota bacterium]
MKIHPKINPREYINFEPLTSEFIQDLIEEGRYFILKKNDFSTTVGILQGKAINKNYDLLIKRFNYRGSFDFFIHKIFKDRAERLWEKNFMLYNIGLPVPIPLQYIKATLGQKHSFFISAALSNTEKLSDSFRKGLLKKEKKLNKQIADSIANFHNSGAIHGDLKWPNILVQANNNTYTIFFIDLDQSSFSTKFNIKGIYEDLIRFYRFGLQLEAEKWVNDIFFPEYLSSIDNKIKKRINIESIINQAETEWIKNGRKRFL